MTLSIHFGHSLRRKGQSGTGTRGWFSQRTGLTGRQETIGIKFGERKVKDEVQIVRLHRINNQNERKRHQSPASWVGFNMPTAWMVHSQR